MSDVVCCSGVTQPAGAWPVQDASCKEITRPNQCPTLQLTYNAVADIICRTPELGLTITNAADAGDCTVIHAHPVTSSGRGPGCRRSYEREVSHLRAREAAIMGLEMGCREKL